MASVFGNVFQLSGGASVWANVFVLTPLPGDGGWIAQPAKRHFVAGSVNRVSITTLQSRVWIARSDNE
jgi:hypothetical protein